MSRPLRTLPNWHDLTLLLFVIVLIFGCIGLVPLVLLIPLVRCYRAGRRWRNGEPGAGPALRRAHSSAMAFSGVSAATSAGVAIAFALGGPSHELWRIVAVTALALLFLVYSSWRVLTWLGPESSIVEDREPADTSHGIQAALSPITTAPADAPPALDENLFPDDHVDWHTFVTNLLLLTSALSLLWSAGRLYRHHLDDETPSAAALMWYIVIPAALLLPTTLCLVAGFRRTHVGTYRTAHATAHRVARGLISGAVVALLLQLVFDPAGLWDRRNVFNLPMTLPGIALMVALAVGSWRVLRALPLLLLLLAGCGGSAEAPDLGRSCESVHGGER